VREHTEAVQAEQTAAAGIVVLNRAIAKLSCMTLALATASALAIEHRRASIARATCVTSVCEAGLNSMQRQDFGVEDPMPNAVTMPPSAIEAIRRSPESQESLRYCMQQERRSARDIPASWFSASQIDFTGSPQSGLVVRGNGCFLGAHITQFWVLAKTATGFRSMFTARADGITVLPTRTNGYRDLQLVFVMAAGNEIQRVTLQYRKGAYRVAGRKIERQ
jgi:hypothetical protein